MLIAASGAPDGSARGCGQDQVLLRYATGDMATLDELFADDFYATFDGPARAIRCALEIAERVQGLGIEIRAGLHTGAKPSPPR